jgi:prevent-host-death family protein
MKEVAISEFKAKCLSILDEVQKTKKPIRVTRFGKAIAEVVPPSPVKNQADWFGLMSDSLEIKGDIVSPVIDLDDIEALRD